MQSVNPFEINIGRLKALALEFEKRVAEGLAEDGRELICMPTYIPSIRLPDSGTAYVIDLGGTNVRAATVSFRHGSCTIDRGPSEAKMPWERDTVLENHRYLDIQAKALAALECYDELPLGYCFSYPAESTLNGDAKLIRWTKEINVPGVEGKNVGALLLKHLSRKYTNVKCSKVVVINDTVASLIAGMAKPEVDAYIGLIVGTGTNMATFIDADHMPKLKNSTVRGILPANLQSSNFSPSYLTRWDEMVDKVSGDIGKHRFEKAVSGAYLGDVFKAVHPESNFNPKSGAQGIAEILSRSHGNKDHVLTASYIYERSARLVAASLAGLIKLVNSKQAVETVRIVAEGSLFWGKIRGESRYLSITQSILKSLLNELDLKNIRFEFENIESANLIGSAIAALA